MRLSDIWKDATMYDKLPTFDDLVSWFPHGEVEETRDGELVVYTGLRIAGLNSEDTLELYALDRVVSDDIPFGHPLYGKNSEFLFIYTDMPDPCDSLRCVYATYVYE